VSDKTANPRRQRSAGAGEVWILESRMSLDAGVAAPRLFALVPCAGTGARAGGATPKQYVPIAGRAMVAHTLDALAQVRRLRGTLVVLAPDDTRFEAQAPRFAGWVARCGGSSRAASVQAGLDALVGHGASAGDWVLVHDAARCLLQPEWVDRLIDACQGDPVGGLLAVPLADTLKSELDGRVAATIDRRGKWAAQTPQMFRIGLLQAALRACRPQVTDESSAVEALGHAPRLVPGSLHNFKVTYPDDFALAERLLEARAS
jgi:2-C-methyl-D-erythritol 4-phosphate cytidylyltransferase